MDVREAVRTAKDYVNELFEEEGIRNIGLEEVTFEQTSNAWKVTIGFSRPWDLKGPLATALVDGQHARSYKLLSLNDTSGRVESLVDRVLETSPR